MTQKGTFIIAASLREKKEETPSASNAAGSTQEKIGHSYQTGTEVLLILFILLLRSI